MPRLRNLQPCVIATNCSHVSLVNSTRPFTSEMATLIMIIGDAIVIGSPPERAFCVSGYGDLGLGYPVSDLISKSMLSLIANRRRRSSSRGILRSPTSASTFVAFGFKVSHRLVLNKEAVNNTCPPSRARPTHYLFSCGSWAKISWDRAHDRKTAQRWFSDL